MLKWGAEYNRRLRLRLPGPEWRAAGAEFADQDDRPADGQGRDRKGPQPAHGFRHAHATSLLSARHNAVAVSKRLGHSKVTITLDVYGHAPPEEDVAASDHFGARLAALGRPKSEGIGT